MSKKKKINSFFVTHFIYSLFDSLLDSTLLLLFVVVDFKTLEATRSNRYAPTIVLPVGVDHSLSPQTSHKRSVPFCSRYSRRKRFPVIKLSILYRRRFFFIIIIITWCFFFIRTFKKKKRNLVGTHDNGTLLARSGRRAGGKKDAPTTTILRGP